VRWPGLGMGRLCSLKLLRVLFRIWWRDVVLGGDEGTAQDIGIHGKTKNVWTIYLQNPYLKTASLMAKDARSAVVLGGCEEGEVWKDIA
jgi:hexaprenyl-diphosphate synthase